MSNDETGGGAAADAPLQFDRAEITTAAPSACSACKRGLVERYWTLNGKSVCGDCKNAVELHMRSPLSWRTWLRVLLRGGGAALLGTLIYFAVLKLTGYEFGLIAIVVGVMVGRAVLKASGGRRGWKLQLAAIALTYTSIVASYMPAVYGALKQAIEKKQGAGAAAATKSAASLAPGSPPSAAPPSAAPPSVAPTSAVPTSAAPPEPATTANAPQPATSANEPSRHGPPTVLAVVVFLAILFVLAAAAPWMAGVHNILGLIIIGIALYEAWKINRRVPLVFAGPFAVSAAPPAATDAANMG